jgi:hypothetical protein
MNAIESNPFYVTQLTHRAGVGDRKLRLELYNNNPGVALNLDYMLAV